jgi:hypothetical protein
LGSVAEAGGEQAAQRGLTDGRQLGDVDAVAEARREQRAQLGGQPGLATARRAHERHQAVPPDRLLQLRDLGVTPDEPSQTSWEPRRARHQHAVHPSPPYVAWITTIRRSRPVPVGRPDGG